MRKLLVTGGAGFIGSAVVRHLLNTTDFFIVNVDNLTYAGSTETLEDFRRHPRHAFEAVDICNRSELSRVFESWRPDCIMHLAAESHVDRSISDPGPFVQTNVIGTYSLLEEVRLYWRSLTGTKRQRFRLHHVSTDEVYGDLEFDAAPFTEHSPYAPSSPYSASKAASDHMVRAWHRTFGIPVVLTNSSNNYGPYQFPEKLIPLVIVKALVGEPLPIYGTGQNVRDWMFVEDHAKALHLILEKGENGKTYNIGSGSERTNMDVVRAICRCLNELKPSSKGPYERLIRSVADRPGHDRRYAIDASLIRNELNWKPVESFESGLDKTVRWYLANLDWADRVLSHSTNRSAPPAAAAQGSAA